MSDRMKTLLLAVLAGGPFVAAVVAGVAQPFDGQVTGGKQVPALAFRQYAVSLGEVRPYPVLEIRYEFTNNGEAPITIDQVTPSCGCLRWQMQDDKMTYAPGETGRIAVTMHTANEPAGPHEFDINVDWHDAKTHQEALTFRVTLPEKKVSVEPHEIYFYQNQGQADTRTVYITDYRKTAGQSLHVLAAEPTSETITTEVLPVESTPSGQARTPVKISAPANVAPGREICYVKVMTDDPEFPAIMIPVLIEGGQPFVGPALPEGGVTNVWEIARQELGLEIH